MSDSYNIGPRLQNAIAQSGMRRAEVAQRAAMKWSHLHRILQGQRPHVSAETVRRLARALNVTTDYLLGMDIP